jgi:2-polyprenyl-3-methyl-5-hydroxy-6-metoxy-1,4-benzoquinol methylase
VKWKTKTRRKIAPPSGAVFDPAAYWAKRHIEHAGTLAAVGHRCLSEEQNAAQYALKRDRIIQALDRFVPEPSGCTLLDAGCGTGVLCGAFASRGYCVTGVDFCASAIRDARERVPQATFLAAPLADLRLHRTFDAVAAVDVLMHVTDDNEWRQTVATLAAHLGTQSVLIILDSTIEDGEPEPPHCRRRPLRLWQTLFDELRLRIVLHDRFELHHEKSVKDLLVCQPEA